MLSNYLKADLLKSLKSAPSFSQIFDENIFVELFWGLGDFHAKKSCQKHQLKQQQAQIWAFSKQNAGTLSWDLQILP